MISSSVRSSVRMSITWWVPWYPPDMARRAALGASATRMAWHAARPELYSSACGAAEPGVASSAASTLSQRSLVGVDWRL